jgi:hypothetical protein
MVGAKELMSVLTGVLMRDYLKDFLKGKEMELPADNGREILSIRCFSALIVGELIVKKESGMYVLNPAKRENAEEILFLGKMEG